MGAEKFAVSFPRELAAVVKAAAADDKLSVSGWLADAAVRKLRRKAAGRAMKAYEKEHGTITEAELARVRRLWPA